MATNKRDFYLTTKDFETGWKSVKLLNLELSELFGATETRQEVQAKMLELIDAHMPDIDTKSNMFWNLCIQSNRCLIKTDKNISVGWTIDNKQVDGSPATEYVFYICLFGKKNDYQAKLLLNGGWKEESSNN